jgi:aryl-alcohol dehydrogenase-like predicted oxidoreductase
VQSNREKRVQGAIPVKKFGKYDDRISALGFGGHHLGEAPDENTAIAMVREAIDGGITFFDNCWEYRRGKTELWMGAALKGKRDKVFLMTKTCPHGRDAALALQMLEESLKRLQTDYLDLWQVHGMGFQNDPDLFIRPNGAAEALTRAKKEGKVRYVGFTGHKDPQVHLGMLKTGFPFDAVQMPLNPFDAGFRYSLERDVLPELNRLNIAALGMKPLNGKGDPVRQGSLTAEEALCYAMSLPVATTITGMPNLETVRQNLAIAQNFKPMEAAEMEQLRNRCKSDAGDGHFELYKVSLKYDNPEARIAHGVPIDMEQMEVKDMFGATGNTGHPFPPMESK